MKLCIRIINQSNSATFTIINALCITWTLNVLGTSSFSIGLSFLPSPVLGYIIKLKLRKLREEVNLR